VVDLFPGTCQFKGGDFFVPFHILFDGFSIGFVDDGTALFDKGAAGQRGSQLGSAKGFDFEFFSFHISSFFLMGLDFFQFSL
jgi:hypothetical protein